MRSRLTWKQTEENVRDEKAYSGLSDKHDCDNRFILLVTSYPPALLIPRALPRAFLPPSVMKIVAERAGLEKKFAARISLAVFAAQSAAGMMFMTAEGSINTVSLSQLPAGTTVTWPQRLLWLCVPALFAGAPAALFRFVFSAARI